MGVIDADPARSRAARARTRWASGYGRFRECRQHLVVVLEPREQVADAPSTRSGIVADRPAVGPQRRGRRARPRRSARRPGAPGAGRTAYGRHERLDRRVLGVVEPGPALAAPFAHSHETRSGTVAPTARDTRSTQPLVSAKRVAAADRDPDLDAALAGRLGIAADAEVPERGPVEPGEDERLVPGRLRAGVDVDQRERRLPRVGQRAGPGVDLEARLVAEPAQRRDAVGDEVVVGVPVLATVDAGLVPAA